METNGTDNGLGAAIMAELREIKAATLLGAKDTLTLEECRLLTGYSRQTLYVLTSKRQIPHYKKGNTLFFSKKDVERWLRSNPVATEAEVDATAETYMVLGGKGIRAR